MIHSQYGSEFLAVELRELCLVLEGCFFFLSRILKSHVIFRQYFSMRFCKFKYFLVPLSPSVNPPQLDELTQIFFS